VDRLAESHRLPRRKHDAFALQNANGVGIKALTKLGVTVQPLFQLS
jgi:hypothetical protein